jgi:hypothetical protein
MKKIQIISKSGLITLWVLCLLYQPAQAQAQDPYTGIWEGTFMNDFKTAVLLDRGDDNGYVGKILMFSGENRIQDDELSKITIENQTISFYIAAKESSFEGTFNEMNTELSGNVIFPDNTKHPLTVIKHEEDSLAVKATAPSIKESLKLKIPVDELKSDLRDLINSLKKYHPRLYSCIAEDTFNEKVSETFASLDSEMTIEEFYLEIAPLVASVQCSHTGIRLPAEYYQYISERGKFLPMDLYIQGKEAYLLSNAGTQVPGLVPGTEILSINQVPVNRIINKLLSIIPAEGDCQTTKYNELNRDFQSYFYLLDSSERFKIEYSSPSGPKYALLEASGLAGQKSEFSTSPTMLPVNFHLEKEPGVGVLKIESFGIMDMEGYFTLLDTVFQMLEKVKVQNLVLDLRNNSGGHPIFAAQLFSYLTDHEFTYFQRNPEVTDFEPLYNPMQANPNHYDGNVYVFVNGGCLSTTGHLISLLKYHTDAVFIGEEPGSTYCCNDFSIQEKLPNTGIEMNIPRTTFVTDVCGFKEGEPFALDFNVQQTIKDQVEGVDRCMYTVRTIIAENITNP